MTGTAPFSAVPVRWVSLVSPSLRGLRLTRPSLFPPVLDDDVAAGAVRPFAADLDGAHVAFRFHAHAEAAVADDDADTRCRTLLDDPTALRGRLLHDVEVCKRRRVDH